MYVQHADTMYYIHSVHNIHSFPDSLSSQALTRLAALAHREGWAQCAPGTNTSQNHEMALWLQQRLS